MKSRDMTLLTKVRTVKVMSFQWSHMAVRAGPKRSRMLKNWCLWTVVLEKTPESPLDSKEIKPVNLQGDQPWTFTGRSEAEAEISIWCEEMTHWKVPEAGKDWGQKEKRVSQNEMGWIASPMQWTWTWANYGRWWGTGSPGMLPSMGSQRVTWLGNWTTSYKVLAIPNRKGDWDMHAVF